MPAERAGYTVTMFVIDVSPSMGKERTIELPPGPNRERRERKVTNLEWSLQYVLLKIQEMIFGGRKTDQCGVILFGTEKTVNCVNREHGGYDHVTEYIPIGQPTAHTLDLVSAIRSHKTVGDPIDGLIVAIQTQDDYLLKKKTWTRKMVLITDGENPMVTSDWKDTAAKLNELDIKLAIVGVDFDDDDFTEEEKSETKKENESFYRKFEDRVKECLLGSCAQALRDCSLPEVKSVSPTSKSIVVRLGDTELDGELSIEIPARVHKVTSKATAVPLKRFIKRGGAKDRDGDETMEETDAEYDLPHFAPVERETKFFLRPPETDKEIKEEEEEDGTPTETERQLGEAVESDDLVRGYKYGASWVLVEEEFEKLPTKAGIEVIGFIHADKFNRWHLMGEVYCLSADQTSAKAQVALSSFVRAMVIKDVHAIVRWVHSAMAEPKMAVCYPKVEGSADYFLMSRVPFAEDIRNYTFPSLDKLINKKGEVAIKHPYMMTDDMLTAMEKWVDKMDLMNAAQDEDGTICPWFDISTSFNPAIHRMKQALFHAATVQDLESNPIPPPHPELTKYLETPSFIVDQSHKALEKLKKALDVKIAPPKVRGKRRANDTDATEHTGDDFDVADVLGEQVGASLPAPSQSLADLSLKSPHVGTMTLAAARRKAAAQGGDTDTEDEDDSTRPPPVHLPTPRLSPPSKGRTAADVRPGRIIGNAFPLNDFRKNLERGDVVSKALNDMSAIIPEMVEESFSSQRYEEALQCMKEMRDVALKEDDIEIWNTFIQDLKNQCLSASFKHKDFWDRVKAVGMSISLITDKEADRNEGYSEYSELQSVQFINS